MAEFKLGRIKFVWKGPWQASNPYYKDDVVLVGGVSYMHTHRLALLLATQ